MKKDSLPLVSIIIVNWNGGNVLYECLISLSRISYPSWELVLVDNGSTDGSEELVNQLKLGASKKIIIKNKANLGFAAANNEGLKKVSGEYILLLNNDTLVETGFLEILVERMESDKDLGVIQPKIEIMQQAGILDNAGSFPTITGFFDHWGFLAKDGSEFESERIIFSAKGACMLIRKDLISKIGLFDKDFFSYFEETDFCWRVWLQGYKILFYPKTRIYHKLGFTLKRLNVLEINYHYFKNRINSLIKNLEISNLIIVLGLHLIICLGISVGFLTLLRPNSSWMVIKSIYWNIANLSNTLRKRKLVQGNRVVGDEEIFSLLMHPFRFSKYLKDFKRVALDIASNRKP